MNHLPGSEGGNLEAFDYLTAEQALAAIEGVNGLQPAVSCVHATIIRHAESGELLTAKSWPDLRDEVIVCLADAELRAVSSPQASRDALARAALLILTQMGLPMQQLAHSN